MWEAIKEHQKLEFSQRLGVSLDVDLGDDGDGTLGDLIADQEALTPLELLAARNLREGVNRAIIDAKLDKREKKIIAQLYGLDGEQRRKQKQIADEMGLSPRRIRQIREIAMEKIISVLSQTTDSHLTPAEWEA